MEIKYKPMYGLDRQKAYEVMYAMEHLYRMEDIAGLLENNEKFQKATKDMSEEDTLDIISSIADVCDGYIGDSGDWYEYAMMAIHEAGY